jgi:hypothetical protein
MEAPQNRGFYFELPRFVPFAPHIIGEKDENICQSIFLLGTCSVRT